MNMYQTRYTTKTRLKSFGMYLFKLTKKQKLVSDNIKIKDWGEKHLLIAKGKLSKHKNHVTEMPKMWRQESENNTRNN